MSFISKRLRRKKEENNRSMRNSVCSSVYVSNIPQNAGGSCLLLIDPQVDFVSGSLAVPGAEEDCKRIAAFIKGNKASLNEIFVTLDTHMKFHIAHPCFWKNAQNNHPAPFTQISKDDVDKKVWQPYDKKLLGWVKEYTNTLETTQRIEGVDSFKLTIWPEHCLLGSVGHAVQEDIQKALVEWERETKNSVRYIVKGNNSKTEHYSAFRAEVTIDDDPGTKFNERLFNELNQHATIYVGGEAKSHCVNFSVRDLVSKMTKEEASNKVILLENGMSSVQGCEIMGDKFMDDMAAKKIRKVKLDSKYKISEDVVTMEANKSFQPLPKKVEKQQDAKKEGEEFVQMKNRIEKQKNRSDLESHLANTSSMYVSNMPSKREGSCLFLIDPQNDFIEAGAPLQVPGAIEDSLKTANFIRDNIDQLEEIYVTLDSHAPYHIAHGTFWKDKDGNPPKPFSLISHDEIKKGIWTPVYKDMAQWGERYSESLETTNRIEGLNAFKLCIWPEHCLIGSRGHAVQKDIFEALQQWEEKNQSCVHYIFKGHNSKSEHYSAFRGEVVVDEDPATAFNELLFKELMTHRTIFVAGQALSHCVNFSVRDLVAKMGDQKAQEKIVLLEGAMSPVPNFEKDAECFLKDMAQKKKVKCRNIRTENVSALGGLSKVDKNVVKV